jgi:hypothetical protein
MLDSNGTPEVNQEHYTVRNQIKWREWIPSWRPVPTALARIGSMDQDVGLFEDATRERKFWRGIFRSSCAGRETPSPLRSYACIRKTCPAQTEKLR